jgi:hypothetical protein
MAAFVKYEIFVGDFANKVHDLLGTDDTFDVALHSDAPVVATDDQIADHTQVTGTGYTAGGQDTQNNGTRSGGTLSVTGVDVVWTAGAADWTAGRYTALYNDTPAGDPLIGNWDYGSSFTLGNGETFTVDFGSNMFTVA